MAKERPMSTANSGNSPSMTIGAATPAAASTTAAHCAAVSFSRNTMKPTSMARMGFM